MESERTPAAPSSTVVSISASRWPSKSCTCQCSSRRLANHCTYDLALDRLAHLLEHLFRHGDDVAC
jgi:hypothetical protein